MLWKGFSHFFLLRHTYKMMSTQHKGPQRGCLWPKVIWGSGSRLWPARSLPSYYWGSQGLRTAMTHWCHGDPLGNSSPKKLLSLRWKSLALGGLEQPGPAALSLTTGHCSPQVPPAHCLWGGVAFAHLHLLVERWRPVRGKHCREVTGSVTTHSARALNCPWKGDFFPAY